MSGKMKTDAGHRETDALLADLEKRVKQVYQQAIEETQAKLDDYLAAFAKKDLTWQEMVKAGEKTAQEYANWRMGQMMIGKRWQDMVDTLAQDYHNANVIARSMISGYMPEAYAINHNYATYEIEAQSGINTSYTLYDRETVEQIIRDQPDLLPPPGKRMKARIAAGKDIAWQKGQIQSVMLQSILQGESIPKIANRITQTLGARNYAAAVRYARTAITGAQNAGRYDAYRRADKMGIKQTITWVATLDNRTRHSHRQLDGQRRKIDEPFEVDGKTILYPGYPTAPQELIWNCRCTMVSETKGLEHDLSRRSTEAIAGDYEAWKQGKTGKGRSNKAVDNVSEHGIIKITDKVSGHSPTPKTAQPNAIIDHLDDKGNTETRTFYDENGMKRKDITNHDHGNPKWHNYGIHGEHAHDYIWDETGTSLLGKTIRELTDDERKENRDML